MTTKFLANQRLQRVVCGCGFELGSRRFRRRPSTAVRKSQLDDPPSVRKLLKRESGPAGDAPHAP